MLQFGLNAKDQWAPCRKVVEAKSFECCCDNKFEIKLQLSSLLKLAFQDGVYDFRTKKFALYEDYKEELFLDTYPSITVPESILTLISLI